MYVKGKNISVKSDWLLVIGLLLVIWGIAGAFGAFQQAFTHSGETDENGNVLEEGFVPYVVPAEQELSAGMPGSAPTLEANLPGGTGEAAATEVLQPAGEDTPQEKQIEPQIPQQILISAIGLDAPVVPAIFSKVEIEGTEYDQWAAPDELAAGWHTVSARLGEIGNTVLNGHHNVHGKIFRNLAYLKEGDLIRVYGEKNEFVYVVTNKMVFLERDVPLEKRMENARWITHSDDERLTLVTCWPYQTNTHRLIIVARPIGR